MTDEHLAIIVLAAGQGTRMKSRLPKMLHPLAGVPLVGHVLATARALDAAHVLAVVRHERDLVAAVIERDFPGTVVVDQDDVDGTGRAVELAAAALPEGFEGEVLVLNGDVPLLDADSLREFLAQHRATASEASVLSARYDDPTGYGRIVRDPSGRFDRIVEQKDATAEERAIDEINAGIYAFGAAALRDQLANVTTDNAQGEKYLTDVIGLLRAAGSEVEAVPVAEPWLVAGVNDRAQLSETAARLNALIVRGWQLNGVTIEDPATTWIDLAVAIEPDVTIRPGTQLKGATVIATGAIVGPDTTLVDCEIGERAEVKRTDATLAVIGADASVGPFSYLRPGTVLDADGKIGAFVETKNAHIGAGSKVPHLSYIGDTEIGVGSNVGAGSITANYDGVNKHRTTIGSHVRTGSHGVFVAPVTIGDGAYTGAGTVVRKDVPAGALAVNVAPQRNIEGWVRQHRAGTAAADAAEAAAEAAGVTESDDRSPASPVEGQ
ncbi:bifunctional UDP-N-acetylglucosamine diphosphorylase/glucosamine-1-phosphate N-acetyltransferase GlmU [Agromyces protaetiae]|uniref:Bifunctional protein GlmU n=1 Tax=Agromyces protaetiae TaxID=2509455 RepID=A0A4P6FG51_9MICO|nr:bifunctional UDP-N-acetylglucosamine diphosphorylase/glucosamine-1-phosphate N-acetyltransferase GlmU [Agromyces protaetiae]QAY73409.1 bifunctional UDP-N-acetylglucosamine diphosphorylase/glucosamine-1-phosphate N-acetyltransferase GlmU [Agromyces protaetiae]